jgi:hypothetical protein
VIPWLGACSFIVLTSDAWTGLELGEGGKWDPHARDVGWRVAYNKSHGQDGQQPKDQLIVTIRVGSRDEKERGTLGGG